MPQSDAVLACADLVVLLFVVVLVGVRVHDRVIEVIDVGSEAPCRRRLGRRRVVRQHEVGGAGS